MSKLAHIGNPDRQFIEKSKFNKAVTVPVEKNFKNNSKVPKEFTNKVNSICRKYYKNTV